MFTVGPGRAPGALEEQAATWCGGHMSGTRRQPVRAEGGCRPVASGSGPTNSLGHGGVAPKHWRLWMEAGMRGPAPLMVPHIQCSFQDLLPQVHTAPS